MIEQVTSEIIIIMLILVWRTLLDVMVTKNALKYIKKHHQLLVISPSNRTEDSLTLTHLRAKAAAFHSAVAVGGWMFPFRGFVGGWSPEVASIIRA